VIDRPRSSVILALPPRADALHVARIVTGSVASRLRLPVDAIDDLRLAVDEASTLLLKLHPRAERIRVELDPDELELRVAISADDAIDGPWPSPQLKASLPWRIISGLSDGVEVRSNRGVPEIVIVKRTLSPHR